MRVRWLVAGLGLSVLLSLFIVPPVSSSMAERRAKVNLTRKESNLKKLPLVRDGNRTLVKGLFNDAIPRASGFPQATVSPLWPSRGLFDHSSLMASRFRPLVTGALLYTCTTPPSTPWCQTCSICVSNKKSKPQDIPCGICVPYVCDDTTEVKCCRDCIYKTNCTCWGCEIAQTCDAS